MQDKVNSKLSYITESNLKPYIMDIENDINSTTRLKKKKLLILGANPETVPLIETAKKMGVYVLVTDYNPKAFAKPFADKSFNVDGMDVSGLVNLAQQEKIDGVLVGVADRLIVPYQKVCDALGLPCYGTKEQCEIFSDKYKFNQVCLKYDITPIPSKCINRDYHEEELNDLNYPVFVKPVDGNSGKGMSLCQDKSDLIDGIEKALHVSKSGKVLLEKYMDCDDIGIYFTFNDGEIYLSSIADRYTKKQKNNASRVCVAATYPSKYLELYLDQLHNKLCSMFKSLKIQNGVLLISAFVKDGKIYVYDPGFRLQGEAPNIHIEAANRFDQKSMLVEFAITGHMGLQTELQLNNDFRFKGKYHGTIWILVKEGEIAIIKGFTNTESDPDVIKIVQRLFIGDIITDKMIGTEAQVLCRIYITCESKNKLIDKINYYGKKIKVFDTKDNLISLSNYKFNFI